MLRGIAVSTLSSTRCPTVQRREFSILLFTCRDGDGGSNQDHRRGDCSELVIWICGLAAFWSCTIAVLRRARTCYVPCAVAFAYVMPKMQRYACSLLQMAIIYSPSLRFALQLRLYMALPEIQRDTHSMRLHRPRSPILSCDVKPMNLS